MPSIADAHASTLSELLDQCLVDAVGSVAEGLTMALVRSWGAGQAVALGRRCVEITADNRRDKKLLEIVAKYFPNRKTSELNASADREMMLHAVFAAFEKGHERTVVARG